MLIPGLGHHGDAALREAFAELPAGSPRFKARASHAG